VAPSPPGGIGLPTSATHPLGGTPTTFRCQNRERQPSLAIPLDSLPAELYTPRFHFRLRIGEFGGPSGGGPRDTSPPNPRTSRAQCRRPTRTQGRCHDRKSETRNPNSGHPRQRVI